VWLSSAAAPKLCQFGPRRLDEASAQLRRLTRRCVLVTEKEGNHMLVFQVIVFGVKSRALLLWLSQLLTYLYVFQLGNECC
jgi:hypothetical protein